MRRPDRGRLRALLVSCGALVAMLLGCVLIPSTSSAFTALVTNTTDTAVSKTKFLCVDTFAGDRRKSSAYFEFALTEPADATTALDSSSSNNPGTYRGSNAKDAASPTACPNDAGGAYQLDGSTSRISTDKLFAPIQSTFSEEIWFKTTSAGKLLGFESGSDGASGNYDKHLYVGGSGRLIYGIYDGATRTLMSPAAVTDGFWHYAVATTGAKGSTLYLDGAVVDANEGYTTAEGFSGYWRIGSGTLGSWPDQPQSAMFGGSVRFAAAYPYVLNSGEVASAWSIGKPGVAPDTTKTSRPTATATSTATAVPEASATPSSTPSQAPVTAAPEPDQTAILVSPSQDPAVSTTQDGSPTSSGN